VTARWQGGSGCRGCRRTGGGGGWWPTAGALVTKGAGGAKCKLTPAQLPVAIDQTSASQSLQSASAWDIRSGSVPDDY
jgi:hypothetical protein